MPILAGPLEHNKYENKNFRAHILGTAPSSPVTGQLYYNSGDNTLYWWNGSTWVSASGGGTSDATTSSKGIVQLAGDLAGTAASPQIATGVIVDADVNASAAIAESKLNLATDAAVGTGSRRTLGSGAQQAMPGNRTLDAITAPAASLSLNSQKITNLLDPTAAQDGATKAYVDATIVGITDIKLSVRVASTANVTISAPGSAIDGVTLSNGDRVLLKDQSTGSQNGIYTFNGAAAAMTRTTDANTSAEVTSGMFTFVEEGTANADSGWILTTNAPITLDTTALVFTQFTGAGQITAGNGLTKTGNTLDVGAGSGITVAADTVAVATNGITNAMIADGAINLASADVTGTLPLTNGGTGGTTAATARSSLGTGGVYSNGAVHGAGTTISITAATHGLGTGRNKVVQVMEEATGIVVLADVTVASNGDVTITFGASVSANTYRVSIVGW